MVTATKGKRKAAGDDEKVVKKTKKEEEKTKKPAKETTKKETKPKKETAKKETKKEAKPKKETAKKETAKKETAKKETAKKETAKKETKPKEATKKETKKETKPKKEATKKETKPKKETKKETKPKKTTKKETEKKEAKKTTAAKEKKEKKAKEEKEEKEAKKETDEKESEDKKEKKKDTKRKAAASDAEPKAKKQKVEAEPKFKIDVKLGPVADVLVMGSGEVGQLGLGTTILGRKRPTVVPQLQAKHILQLEVGGLHNAVLVQDASAPTNTRLWTWGCNDNKILGRDTPVQEDETVDLSMVPDVVPALNDKRIVSVTSGEFHMCALSNTGELYLWGTYKDNEGFLGYSKDQKTEQAVPRIFPGLEGVAIKQVSSAHNHTIALTSTGEVLIWGFHWLGRTVSDRKKRDYLSPQGVNFRKKGKSGKKPKIVHVDAGGYQSFAVAEDGTVYAWGLNNYGQLGTGNTKDTGAPTEVPGLSHKNIISIAAGLHHTIALASDGLVYSFGRGDYGQLGHGDTANSIEVKEIWFFTDLLAKDPANKVIQITSIDNHCTAVTQNGSLYAWGFGDRGQIGNATADIDGEDATTPFKVEGPQLKTRKVIAAGAGGQHTAMLGVSTEAAPATSSTTANA